MEKEKIKKGLKKAGILVGSGILVSTAIASGTVLLEESNQATKDKNDMNAARVNRPVNETKEFIQPKRDIPSPTIIEPVKPVQPTPVKKAAPAPAPLPEKKVTPAPAPIKKVEEKVEQKQVVPIKEKEIEKEKEAIKLNQEQIQKNNQSQNVNVSNVNNNNLQVEQQQAQPVVVKEQVRQVPAQQRVVTQPQAIQGKGALPQAGEPVTDSLGVTSLLTAGYYGMRNRKILKTRLASVFRKK